MLPTILLYIVIFLYGIVIGSFLNVLIYRIPKKENIVTTRSHCMNCGYQLNGTTLYRCSATWRWEADVGNARHISPLSTPSLRH